MNTTTNASGYEAREGRIARAIEARTVKLPSDVFLWAAGASVVGAVALHLLQPRRMKWFGAPSYTGQLALLVGEWAPTLLMLGLYNKIVKVAGSDRTERRE